MSPANDPVENRHYPFTLAFFPNQPALRRFVEGIRVILFPHLLPSLYCPPSHLSDSLVLVMKTLY